MVSRRKAIPVSFGLAAGVASLTAPAARRAVAAETTPRDLIDRYSAALNNHDPEAVAALYTDHAMVRQMVANGGMFHGRVQIAGLIAANLHGIPDLTVTTEDLFGAGDRIAWAWRYAGAYTGQFPGLPAGRGQSISLAGVSLFTVENGLIASESLYFDNASFIEQADDEAATPTA